MGALRIGVLCVLALAACKVPNASRTASDGPVCGNGIVEAGEVCDDGNTVSCDGCSADCKSDETCGNSIVDCGEQCDDGNNISCDGCSADCKSDETCGNGIVDTCKGETCDDGNNISGDGCSATCQSNEKCGNCITDTAAGEQCDGCGVQTASCEVDCKSPKCGDGILNKLAGEECDDGNLINGDGCDDKCRKEVCGNGRVEDDEQCDDGIDALDGPCPKCHFAVCGDFYVWRKPSPPKEQCDEGPTPNIHGACPHNCVSATCGDGYLWNTEGGTEQCDDGNTNTNDACPACRPARCGDGYRWTVGCTGNQCEQCDSGGTDSATCVGATCRTSICGDNHVNTAAGEQCDLGSSNSDNGACTSSCQNARCGDGLVYTGVEDCDTGGTDTATCNAGTCTTSMCGDMYVNMAAGEQCDLGSNNNDNGACTSSCQNAVCGDGLLYTGVEQCDDGSNNGNDGVCNTDCTCVNGPPC